MLVLAELKMCASLSNVFFILAMQYLRLPFVCLCMRARMNQHHLLSKYIHLIFILLFSFLSVKEDASEGAGESGGT